MNLSHEDLDNPFTISIDLNLKVTLTHLFDMAVGSIKRDELCDIPHAYHGSLPSRCANQPKDLAIKLYEYQAKGLGW